MQAEEVGFLDLFHGKVQYVVPKWQRRYCWGEADVRRLVDDLISITEAPKPEMAHYGGSLITFSPPGQPPGVPGTERVVDGQQRLTTVSLLLKCIADSMDDADQYGEWTQEDIRDLLVNSGEAGLRKRKLRLQAGDEDEYVRILQGKPEGDGAVANAWGVVRDLVGRHGPDKLMAGIERFRVVSLGVGANDDPQQIFESLNATGLPLTESEKVKNWLLMGLPDAEQQEMYEDYWLVIEKKLRADHSSRPVDIFLRDFMRWKTGRIRAIGQTYEVFRRWAIKEEWDTRRKQLCRQLAHLAGLYGILTGTAGPHPEAAIESSLRHLRAMGINTHRPFTLRLLHELSPRDGGAISTPEQMAKVFEAVSIWITRLWLADWTVRGLNDVFARMAARDSVNPEVYSDHWINRIRGLRGHVGVPRDEDVARGIRTRGVYRAKKASLAVLCALAEADDGEEAWSRNDLWTERVMPMRGLTDAWREPLGPEAEEVHVTWRYRLANLALVGGVKGVSWGEYRSFAEKKEWYRKSPVGLTRRLGDEADWDEAALERRSEDLAKQAIPMWPWEHAPMGLDERIRELRRSPLWAGGTGLTRWTAPCNKFGDGVAIYLGEAGCLWMYGRADSEPGEARESRMVAASWRIVNQFAEERFNDTSDRYVQSNAKSGFTISIRKGWNPDDDGKWDALEAWIERTWDRLAAILKQLDKPEE